MSKINITLVDDSEIFRFGIRNILEEEDNFIISESSSSSELFNQLNSPDPTPDIILLDIRLQKNHSLSGLEIVEHIKAAGVKSKIIILTSFGDREVFKKALKSGVDGFLPKEAVTDEIIESIKMVSSGKNYLGKTIPFDIIQSAFDNKPKKSDALTKTEKKIFILISQGFQNREIADKLHVSIHTIETHKANIKNKLNIKSGIDYLAIAIEDEVEEIMKYYGLKKDFCF